ncbi:glucose-6-phosphate isomerase [Candidatus Saccharibacteria bacterium]|nr:glucose-6-phosphate isomerase [Candidatus Saccharibacteria bacterium]MCL1962998.1 glucose-6-phosphate isomerase [Candidatus Saccharibacteria bacterium]
MIKLDTTRIAKLDLTVDSAKNNEIIERIHQDSFGGWLNLPDNYDRDEFMRILAATKQIQANSDFLICVGIGGSYLGARAVIEALGNTSKTTVLYAGNSLSTIELNKIIKTIAGHDWSINVISKSGTTTEPAIAFRILKQKLIDQYGEQEAGARIYATTDAVKGALHDEAVAAGYHRFVVPDDIGGRYSVLTAVGLLPIAVAGIDVAEMMKGAADESHELMENAGGDAAVYAAVRNYLYSDGKNIEILANFEPTFAYFNEWYKQLAGESEGKDQKGIFPASVVYTTDLHSMGQYIQDGSRDIFESIIDFADAPAEKTNIPKTAEDTDGLGYLTGKALDYVNAKALEATLNAHRDGGISVLRIIVPDISARSIGALIYFFELTIAMSGFILGVNPFDQPGVEAYKTEMFRLLGKPGYEK